MDANKIIQKHYNLDREVTDEEVIDELVNLRRRIKKLSLSDMDADLASKLNLHPITGKTRDAN